MALLKKGAKGPDVEKFQKRLNQLGAKLKIDGIFGSKTESAVKTFQKKAKLKADGKVGDWTWAALDYGGALPEMSVDDYTKLTDRFRQAWDHNKQATLNFVTVQREVAALNKVWNSTVPKLDKMFAENTKYWEDIAKRANKIIALQKEFEGTLPKSPDKAAKIVAACEKLDADIAAYRKANLTPNHMKMQAMADNLGKTWRDSSKVIQDLMVKLRQG